MDGDAGTELEAVLPFPQADRRDFGLTQPEGKTTLNCERPPLGQTPNECDD